MKNLKVESEAFIKTLCPEFRIVKSFNKAEMAAAYEAGHVSGEQRICTIVGDWVQKEGLHYYPFLETLLKEVKK
jgi:hypothetical protein